MIVTKEYKRRVDTLMHLPYTFQPMPARFCRQFSRGDSAVPQALFTVRNEVPQLDGFPLPLPSRKKDYTCFVRDGGVFWYGASTGLTRYEPDAPAEDLIMQYFSADRDLQDNCVKALLLQDGVLWVLTETGVTSIEIKIITAEEKALLLLEESKKVVDRRGMYSQKDLAKPRDLNSAVSYGHSDNDGGFTAGFSAAEMYHYAVLRREKGKDHPETIAARKDAVRACEACLLLMHIHGRGDGFIARSYMCPDEPLPENGVYFLINGDKATCMDTPATRERGSFAKMYGVDVSNSDAHGNMDACWSGMVIDASAPVPERLAKLYTDLGYTRDGIFYKADTSSDEVTLHFMQMTIAHDIIKDDDPELDALIQLSAKALMDHIIDHGYELCDCTGEPTTWAKWSERYFNTEFGYVDSCLNSAEVLAYHLMTMHITGETTGKYKDSYDYLLSRGYADLCTKHWDHLVQSCMADGIHPFEDIMYGDHMLATVSFWMLCTLETDETLLQKYRAGYKQWRTSLEREYDPGYDLPFALACPDEEIDMERMAQWLYRMNVSRLASGVSTITRHDTPVHKLPGGYEEISWLLPNDERFVSKYDRNPFERKDEDSGGRTTVESCYIYTFAYWMGRYYGFFE